MQHNRVTREICLPPRRVTRHATSTAHGTPQRAATTQRSAAQRNGATRSNAAAAVAHRGRRRRCRRLPRRRQQQQHVLGGVARRPGQGRPCLAVPLARSLDRAPACCTAVVRCVLAAIAHWGGVSTAKPCLARLGTVSGLTTPPLPRTSKWRRVTGQSDCKLCAACARPVLPGAIWLAVGLPRG